MRGGRRAELRSAPRHRILESGWRFAGTSIKACEISRHWIALYELRVYPFLHGNLPPEARAGLLLYVLRLRVLW